MAICIDHRELFRLGLILDEIFHESNRIGIINWQKTTVKNNAKSVASSTEYVLVYSKRADRTVTGLLSRSEKSNSRFGNPDKDPHGEWKQGDITGTGADSHKTALYAVQSPFDGELCYPPQNRCWAYDKKKIKTWLEAWGSKYHSLDLADGRTPALVLAGWSPSNTQKKTADIITKASAAAKQKLVGGSWPRLYFGMNGTAKPMAKVYLNEIKAGIVPTTFWVDEEALEIDSTSWSSSESGRSREGVEELDALMGSGHNFKTVKPLKLFYKIIQIWCPSSGIVLDPFAGSGTTGHAVLALNADAETSRRFILIEQGRPEKGDPYAKGLTAERVRRAISGTRVSKDGEVTQSAVPLPGAFRFVKLDLKVDRNAVLALEREEMIDLLLTSHWDQSERSSAYLRRLPAGEHKHLFAVSARNEGFFVVWNGPALPAVLDRAAFREVVEEAKSAGLSAPYHVYARTTTYSGPNIEFYQIPDRILEKLGFNELLDAYSNTKSLEEVSSE